MGLSCWPGICSDLSLREIFSVSLEQCDEGVTLR